MYKHLWHFVEDVCYHSGRNTVSDISLLSLCHVFAGTSPSWSLVGAVVANERTVLGEFARINVAILVQRRRLITRL